MNFKKVATIAAAAGALAAISVPAMAFENEFHGLYNFNTIFSNFQNGTAGDLLIAGSPEHRKTNNYFEQRVRLQYTAKASDDLKMVTQFEIDNRFGDANTDLDTDSTNIEVKHAYLDFNVANVNVKTGLMAYKDTIKGLFINADVPAIMTTTKFGAYTLGVGFSRFDDDAAPTVANSNTVRLGDKNKDLFILDNTFALSKDTKVALSYYFLADYAAGSTGFPASNTLAGSNILESTGNGDNAILISTLGLSGETKIGPATVSGFIAGQAGHQKDTRLDVGGNTRRDFHGFAANVAAKMAMASGTARTAFLFTSGDNSEADSSDKGWVTSSVNSYDEGGMMILARNNANNPGSTDRYIRRNVTNIALLTMGYDANLSDKLFAKGNVGLGWTPASIETDNNCDFMGAEVNAEVGYKLYTNLTLKAQAAYMVLGGLYNNTGTTTTGYDTDPQNPYSMRLHAQFAF